jgi:putative hemolysin
VQVDGGMSVLEAREELDLSIPEGDYETIAGYILSVLGHLPNEGEKVVSDGFHITVTEVKARKIEQVVITRLPASPAGQAEADRQ